MPEEPPVSVSTEDVQAAPRRTGRSRVDLILALTAIFLSAISLYVAIQNANTQRDLVAADTWPFVSVGIKNGANDKNDLVISIANSGVGPAKLQSFEVFYKGKPVKSAFDLLQRCCGLPSHGKALADAVNGHLRLATVENLVLRAGEEVEVIALRPAPVNQQVIERLLGSINDISYHGCYCSVLDECWETDFGSTRVNKVKLCPVPKHQFITNAL